MTEEERLAAIAEWVASLPEPARVLATEFPPNVIVRWGGLDCAIIGYTENDQLILTPFALAVAGDRDAMLAAKAYLCAAHLRTGDVSRSTSGQKG